MNRVIQVLESYARLYDHPTPELQNVRQAFLRVLETIRENRN